MNSRAEADRDDQEQAGVQVDEEHERETGTPPVGAILVTSFLALMILISWFGMYFLDFLRG